MGANNAGDQSPQHTVKFPSPYYIAKSKVTFGQFYEIMGYYPLADANSSQPVFLVTRDEARLFCAKLSLKTGVQCRLPTEAEWEYVARNRADLNLIQSGSYEFVEDDYHPDYQGAPADGSAWYGGNWFAVLRGGGVSARKSENPTAKSYYFSFRVVVVVPPIIRVSLQSASNPDHYIRPQEDLPDTNCKLTTVSAKTDSISATFWFARTLDINNPSACVFFKQPSFSFLCNSNN